MPCGWLSVLSIRSVSGRPTWTAKSVWEYASCFLPSEPSLDSGLIVTTSTQVGDVRWTAALAAVGDGVPPMPLLTSAIAYITSEAKISMRPSAGSATLP